MTRSVDMSREGSRVKRVSALPKEVVSILKPTILPLKVAEDSLGAYQFRTLKACIGPILHARDVNYKMSNVIEQKGCCRDVVHEWHDAG